MRYSQIKTANRILSEQGFRGLAQVMLLKLSRAQHKSRIPNVSDQYIKLLKFSNAGMLSNGNINCFDYAIKNLPSKSPIVEIGSFLGLSTNVITYFLSKYDRSNIFFTCDNWKFQDFYKGDRIGEYSDIAFFEFNQYIKQSYMKNISIFSRRNLPYTIEMYSDDFFENWKGKKSLHDIFDREIHLGGPISFAYIDGNHSYEFCKRDFMNCDRHLEIGGFVLFDDSGDGTGWGACKVVQEVLESGKYELIDNSPNYFFKKLG